MLGIFFFTFKGLDHNFELMKESSVSNGPAFLWQVQIQTIHNGLNDIIQIKKKGVKNDTLLMYTLWYEYSYDFDAQSDFGKNFVAKKLVRWSHSYL